MKPCLQSHHFSQFSISQRKKKTSFIGKAKNQSKWPGAMIIFLICILLIFKNLQSIQIRRNHGGRGIINSLFHFFFIVINGFECVWKLHRHTVMAFPLLGIEFLVIEKITNAYILVIVKKNLKFSYLSWRAIYININGFFFLF